MCLGNQFGISDYIEGQYYVLLKAILSVFHCRSHQQILLGDRVIIRGEHLGVVRYIGKVDFDNRPFIGVALDAPIGICDGQMYGKRYFTCPPKHGVLVRPTDVYSVIGRKVYRTIYTHVYCEYNDHSCRCYQAVLVSHEYIKDRQLANGSTVRLVLVFLR